MRARRFRKSPLTRGRLGILPAVWSSVIWTDAASNRLVACRRKMTPSTGMQYSDEVSFELARRLSAASQRLSSSFSMSCNAVAAKPDADEVLTGYLLFCTILRPADKKKGPPTGML